MAEVVATSYERDGGAMSTEVKRDLI